MTVETGSAATARLPWLPFNPLLNRAVTVTLVAVAVGGSLVCGIGVATGQKRLAVIPIIAVLCVMLAVVACTRFSWFVLLLLAVRPSTDVLKLSASDAGTSASNTVAARGADPSSLIGVAFLMLAVMWLASVMRSRKGIRPSLTTLTLLAFTLAGALSVFGSSHVQASALQLVRLTSAILMFVVLEQLITTRVMMKRVLKACIAALVITMGYTVFSTVMGGSIEVKGDFTRLTGTFSQSNDYGRYLMFLVLIGVAILPYVSRRLRNPLIVILLAAGGLLVMTLTLGAIATGFAGCLIIALIQRRVGLAAFLGVAILAALSMAPALLARIALSTTETQVGGGSTGNSVSWRLQFWASLLSINDNNPVTGVGLNTTQYFTPSAKQPHSDFLSAYVETGILGFVLYIALLAVMVFATGRVVLRTEPKTLEWGVAVGALVVVVSFAVVSLAANVIQSLANFWLVLAIVACALAVGRRHELPWDRQAADRPSEWAGTPS